MGCESDFLEMMSREIIQDIDREIMEEFLQSIRGWVYFVPNFVYYIPPPTVYAGVE